MNSIIFSKNTKSKEQINDFLDEIGFRRIQTPARLFSDIQAKIEEYIRQEQLLLSRLIKIKAELEEPSVDIEKSNLDELNGAIVGERALSGRATRHRKRITQAYVEQKHFIETTHQQYLDKILLYLRGISVKMPRLKEPNSQKLVDKVNKAQNQVKLEKRIRKTIITLRTIAKKDLIPNTEIGSDKDHSSTFLRREAQQILYKMRARHKK